MSIFEIVLISIGLAMDAFGVSIGKGLTMPVGENGRKVTLAFLFGLFQFLMPLIGWLIGRQFIDVISDWDHWIIFGLIYGPICWKICRYSWWRCINSHRYKDTLTAPWNYRRILKLCIYKC